MQTKPNRTAAKRRPRRTTTVLAAPAVADASRTLPAANDAPAMIKAVLLEAVRRRASDVHIDRLPGGGAQVRLRVDGALQELRELSDAEHARVVEGLKTMAGMNLAERRTPQDGRLMLSLEGHEVDVRVSDLPVCDGERLVMRILDRRTLCLSLDRVVESPVEREQILGFCRLSHGLVLCTGPVGSGKTTLLYAMLMALDCRRQVVITIEDPIECRLPDVAQVQILPSSGLTFARALRAGLRQDPDIFMVGELRDIETVQCAAQAALTGHLVLSAMHTNTAAGALRRLIDVGLEPHLINSVMQGVVAQRLVRRLCPACREPAAPDRTRLPAALLAWLDAQPAGSGYFRAKGCDACHGTGFRGRTALHEVLVMGPAVREAVAAGASTEDIHAAARSAGLKPLLLHGAELAAQGLTSLEEVVRVSPISAS